MLPSIDKIDQGISDQFKIPQNRIHTEWLMSSKYIRSGGTLCERSPLADDLDEGGRLAALGGLDGIERQIDTMRSLLLLIP